MANTVDHYGVSERRVCRVIGQCRATQRYSPRKEEDEERLRSDVIRLASEYGRYGYKRITALLRQDGWHVNHKRVARIWREEGLKVPSRQPKRSRLWLNDGSCVRLRPEYPNHVSSYDFVAERTHDNRSFRILTLIDEYSKESLALEPKRKIHFNGCDRGVIGSVCHPGITSTYTVRSWPGVHIQGHSAMAH